MTKQLEWGPVVVAKGRHKGRIGYYDDDDDEGCIVYFGNMLLGAPSVKLPVTMLRPVTTNDLMRRREEISREIALGRKISPNRRSRLLLELMFILEALTDRLFLARYGHVDSPANVFISHSSRDKVFVRWLATDLANAGHRPWLDEWEISAGESIPRKLNSGIESCEYMVLVLSEHAVSSRWVEREWHAKYWREVESGAVSLIPAVVQDCTVPALIAPKKYADFRMDYNVGLDDLLLALGQGPLISKSAFSGQSAPVFHGNAVEPSDSSD